MTGALQLVMWRSSTLPAYWYKQIRGSKQERAQIEEQVRGIIQEVAQKGDAALIEYTEKFDGAKLTPKTLRVTRAEIEEAYMQVDKTQIEAIRLFMERLSENEKLRLASEMLQVSRDGVNLRTVLCPIESVGCYVPGGSAAYPSTVIMTVTPARTARVGRIALCSPPNKKGRVNPLTLVAADICGVDEFYKIGGAQAIAALAYGTESVEPVKKIVGPGNKYVTTAKNLVSKDVAIDMPAGPSEVLILADETADPKLIALDLISQAEHGIDSVVGLVTTSENVAAKVLQSLQEILPTIQRREIVCSALKNHGFIILCNTVDEMVRVANVFAPEHAELIIKDTEEVASQLTSVGIILVGPYSPVPLSDYASGTNHVLPTGCFGHSYSGLTVFDFIRRVNIVEGSKEGLVKIARYVKALAEAEGLPNHYKALEARLKNE